jgi:NADH-quinone oxidoreductase subunit J
VLLASASIPDALTFVIAAVIVVGGALGVVFMANPVHSALMLVMTLFGIAVLFVEEDAQFLAAVQVIVYAGAIVVLFLFVIMLIGVDRAEALRADPHRGQRAGAIVLGIAVLAEVILLGSGHWTTGAASTTGKLEGQGANVSVLGKALFTTYLLPFEVTSALLVVAVVAAVVLARRPESHQPSEPEIGEIEATELRAVGAERDEIESGAVVGAEPVGVDAAGGEVERGVTQ